MDNLPDGLFLADPEAAAVLASRLLREHAREIRDVSGLDPAAAVLLSLAVSREAYVYVPPGEEAVAFVMGVEDKSPLTGSAMVWLLGAEAMRRRPVALLRAARWGLRRAFLATGAERLEQFIPAWYRTGLHFARRLGFAVAPGGGRLRHVVLRRGREADILPKGRAGRFRPRLPEGNARPEGNEKKEQ